MSKALLFRQKLSGDVLLLCGLALVKLSIHFLTNGQYGYFRDELYYLACGEHLDWGYVDQSPLIAVVAKASRAVLGDSLFAIRFFPALAGAALVFLTGWLARELGGGRFALTLAALALIIAPYYLATASVLTMNAFEPLFWTACVVILVRLIKTGDERLWLLFGLVAGVGLMNKHSTLLFGFSIVVALLLTPARKYLLSKWLPLAGVIAALIFLPNVLWQIAHNWPTVELLRNADANQNLPISPVEFLAGQVLMMHPLTLPLWLAGLCFYLFAKAGRPYRVLGWTYVVMLALMLALRAKIYYLSPIYPILFAPGALAFENFIARRNWQWLKPITVGLLMAGGAALAPLSLPMLPVETFIRYAGALGIEPPRTEKLRIAKLPQHYADMHGWEELVQTVARVYHSLPPDERAKCAIFASNYGEAGAIDFFGPKYGLPKAISGHQNYFLWGPRDYTGEIVLTVGEELKDVQKSFAQIERAAIFTHEYVLPHQNDSPIFVCRQPKAPLKTLWPEVKCYSC